MPDIAQQDIAYQPAIKGYSFSTNPSSPENGEGKKRSNNFVLLLVEILGLAAVFVVFLLILNFFNVLSLSNLYPNQLGFLPHLTTAQNQTAGTTSTPAFTPVVDTSIITTKDSTNNINQYRNYTVLASHYFTQDSSWMVGGVFAGYGKNSIMLISANNTLVLNLNAQTVFEQVEVNSLQGSSAATMGFIPISDFNSFIKAVSFGKYLQVYYNQTQSASGKTATKVDYIPSYKF